LSGGASDGISERPRERLSDPLGGVEAAAVSAGTAIAIELATGSSSAAALLAASSTAASATIAATSTWV